MRVLGLFLACMCVLGVHAFMQGLGYYADNGELAAEFAAVKKEQGGLLNLQVPCSQKATPRHVRL